MAPRSRITVHTENVYTVVIHGKGILIYSFFTFFDHRMIFTTVTKNPDVATRWIRNNTEYVVRPFDHNKNPDHVVITQWIKNSGDDVVRHVGFEVEFEHNKRIGTVQLCVGNRCLIFQLIATSLPPSLAQFLGSRSRVFVGTNILSKIELLRQQFPFSEVVNYMEMGHYVPMLRDIKDRLLDSIELAGEVQKDWARPNNLSITQVHYATLDAFLNIHIAKFLWNVH